MLHFVPASDSDFKPRNTQCIPAFKIFALTRGIHAPRPSGKIDFVQFRYPAELPLNLNKIEHFSKVSLHEQLLKFYSHQKNTKLILLTVIIES